MLKTSKTRSEFVDQVVNEVMIRLDESIAEFGGANMLLSGGGTPGPIYKELERRYTSMERVTLGLVDERFVGPTSEFSNERLVKECFSSEKNPNYQIIGMVSNASNKERNLNNLKADYSAFIERTDVLILGMGKDGHTASIFPKDGHSDIALTSEEPFLNTTAPSHPTERITSTLSLIKKATHVFLLITGKEKLAVFNNKSLALPIHKMLEQRNDLIRFYAE